MAKAVLEQAASESLSLGHNYIGCEHMLLGLVAVEEGLASQVLRRMGVELRTTRRAVIATLTEYIPAREQAVPAPPAALAEATAESCVGSRPSRTVWPVDLQPTRAMRPCGQAQNG